MNNVLQMLDLNLIQFLVVIIAAESAWNFLALAEVK